MHLLVVGLFEVLIPESDRVERLWHLEAHEIIGEFSNCGTSLRCADRHRDDDLSRTLGAQRGDCGAHRRTGSESIVDENYHPIRDGRKGPIVAVELLAPLELAALALAYAVEHVRIDAIRPQDGLVDNAHATAGDGTDSELLVAWKAELSHDEHIQGRVERHGDLERDWYTAAGQAKHDHVATSRVSRQFGGQLSACLHAVQKALSHSRHLPACALVQPTPFQPHSRLAIGRYSVSKSRTRRQTIPDSPSSSLYLVYQRPRHSDPMTNVSTLVSDATLTRTRRLPTVRALATLGRVTRHGVEAIGASARFAVRTLGAIRDIRTWGPSATLHMRRLGVDSLPIGVFIAVFTGIVLALLASYSITGAVPLYFVGTLVEKTITMELAPVLTGLALAGRVGANIAAELGTMRVTEQIDALETLGYDPHSYLVVPRVLAGTIMFPVVVGRSDDRWRRLGLARVGVAARSLICRIS